MKRQLKLPGISERPTAADIKALVKSRMLDFELRREEKARRRDDRARPGAEEFASRPSQETLFPSLRKTES